jgi:hypothetical protein
VECLDRVADDLLHGVTQLIRKRRINSLDQAACIHPRQLPISDPGALGAHAGTLRNGVRIHPDARAARTDAGGPGGARQTIHDVG